MSQLRSRLADRAIEKTGQVYVRVDTNQELLRLFEALKAQINALAGTISNDMELAQACESVVLESRRNYTSGGGRTRVATYFDQELATYKQRKRKPVAFASPLSLTSRREPRCGMAD